MTEYVSNFARSGVVIVEQVDSRPLEERITGIKQATCETCAALCCRQGVKMELSEGEAAFMQAQGTELERGQARPTRRLLPFLGVRKPQVSEYKLGSDCGALREDSDKQPLCGAYEHPSRPAICGDFQPGSIRCRDRRVRAGIDTKEEFQAFLTATNQGAGDRNIRAA